MEYLAVYKTKAVTPEGKEGLKDPTPSQKAPFPGRKRRKEGGSYIRKALPGHKDL